jgi:hypothetical protein
MGIIRKNGYRYEGRRIRLPTSSFMKPYEVEGEWLRVFTSFFSFDGNPIFMDLTDAGPHGNGVSSSDHWLSGVEDSLGGDSLDSDLGVDVGSSERSRSFGVGRRSKELEEAEVRAEVEEDDLFVKVDQEDSSNFAEVTSRFDVRRTEGAAGWLLPAF